jgi:hypothetical protein
VYIYAATHTTPQYPNSLYTTPLLLILSTGITMVNEEDNVRIGRPRKAGSSPADDLNNASGLWNAQPFKANKPPAPIPEAPGGCARATPLSNVQRISHGTGTGATTVAGFWIPTVESATAAMTAASLRGWSYGASSSIGGWQVTLRLCHVTCVKRCYVLQLQLTFLPCPHTHTCCCLSAAVPGVTRHPGGCR